MKLYLEKFCLPLKFGDEEQILRNKIVNKILSEIPGGFERFDETFSPCNRMKYALLNFKTIHQLDRAYGQYIRDVTGDEVDFLEEDEYQYVQKLLRWRPSHCFKANFQKNQLSLF